MSEVGAGNREISRFWHRTLVAACSGVGTLVLRLLWRTWRVDLTEAVKLDAAMAGEEPVIGVFWHCNYLPLFPLLSGRSALVATSHSFRGEVIAEICRSFGYRAVLVGGRNRSSSDALRAELARPKGLVATAADGPLGPPRVAKHGIVALAEASAAKIVPIAARAERMLVLSRRWDKLQLPLPTSRVILRVGEPISVQPNANRSDAVDRLSAAIEALAGQP